MPLCASVSISTLIIWPARGFTTDSLRFPTTVLYLTRATCLQDLLLLARIQNRKICLAIPPNLLTEKLCRTCFHVSRRMDAGEKVLKSWKKSLKLKKCDSSFSFSQALLRLQRCRPEIVITVAILAYGTPNLRNLEIWLFPILVGLWNFQLTCWLCLFQQVGIVYWN